MSLAEHNDVEMARLSLEELVRNTSDLPAMPQATQAVMQETQSATGTAHSVARTLSHDLALTARVLRLANSPFYGMQRRVACAEEAVVVLGMRAVHNLATVASTYHWIGGPLMSPMDFWEHSWRVAVGSQVIASRVSGLDADVAFTCGLLHDIGKVALSAWTESRVSSIHALASDLKVTVLEAEQSVFGFDHQVVGGRLAEDWGLPKVIIDSASYHHNPSNRVPGDLTVDAVHVADFLASRPKKGEVGGKLDLEALRRIGFRQADLKGLRADCQAAFEANHKLFVERAA